jgi:hypothetical protein
VRTHYCITKVDPEPEWDGLEWAVFMYWDGRGEPQEAHHFKTEKEARRHARANLRRLQEISYPGGDGL